MKVALIGPGIKEIPPIGWGAIESVIWDYNINLKNLGHKVDIYNSTRLNEVIKKINSIKYDIVHIMYDDYIIIAPRINFGKILYTSHFAYLTSYDKYKDYYNNILKVVIKNQKYIYINALSKEIMNVYIKEGFPKDKIKVVHNGAREDKFNYNINCIYKEKSIYLAKIEERKKQYLYQNIKGIDFVGNYHNSSFDIKKDNYLGEWNKENLYNNLTKYANLILLSDGEADPLVVKEALICGLGVVISEYASANLDLDKNYIDVIPNEKLNDINYIEEIIIKNRKISVDFREEIRTYALKKFSWNNIIKDNYF
jgi:hypothetical protein